MGLIRSLTELQPETQKRAQYFISLLKVHALDFLIVETARTILVQKAYYAQGREPLETVNEKRKAAGLWEITEKENGRKITWTMDSKHLIGYAIDIVPFQNGKILWSAPFSTYEQYGVYGEAAGFDWGGRWNQKDMPHYELSDSDIMAANQVYGWTDAGAGIPRGAVG